MLFIIGSENTGYLAHSEIVVQRIELDHGVYHLPKRARGYYDNSIKEIAQYIIEQMPNQIIFDSHGDGYLVEDVMTQELSKYGIHIEKNGIVIYPLH